MDTKTLFLIFCIAIIAAQCQNHNERNQHNHPRIPFTFPIPYFPFSNYYDPTTAYKNNNYRDYSRAYENNLRNGAAPPVENENMQYGSTTETSETTSAPVDVYIINEEIKKIFEDKDLRKCYKNCNFDQEENIGDDNITANLLRREIKEKHEKVFDKKEKSIDKSIKLENVTDTESAIVFRDDDEKRIESKVKDENRHADTLTEGDTYSNNTKNDTDPEISRNKDYLLLPATMPVNNLATTNSFSDPVNTQTSQAVPAVLSENNVLQGINGNNVQYINSVPQSQGKVNYVPINNVSSPANNVGMNPNTYTLVNIPNNIAQGIGIPNQQNVVYYVLNSANNMNSANVPTATSNTYQLVTIPNNLVSNNNQPLLFNNQQSQNIQPNNVLLVTNQPNNQITNAVVPVSNQQNLVTFSSVANQQIQPTLMSQLNNLVAFSNQPSVVTLTNSPNTVTLLTNQPNTNMLNQPSTQLVDQPIQNQASNLVIIPNQSSNQVGSLNIATNQPTASQVSNLAISNNQPTASQVSNLVISNNQPTASQVSNLAISNNQPTASQVSNLVISNNQPTASQVSNLAILTNQPIASQVNNQAIATNQPSNIQASNLVIAPNNVITLANQPNLAPSLLSNSGTPNQPTTVVLNNGEVVTNGQSDNGANGSEGPSYLLINTKDEVEEDINVDEDK